MAKTIDITEFEPGTIRAEHRADQGRSYTAIRVANLCGYSSDRWTRDQRATLEQMLLKCANGDELVASMKSENGQYSQFGLELIQELQSRTSTAVPRLKNGEPVMKGGKAVLDRVEREMSLPQFEQMLIAKYGETADYAEFEALDPGGIPGGMEPEQAEEGELVSTALVFRRRESLVPIQIADSNAQIVADTQASMKSFADLFVDGMGELGDQLGAAAVQNFQSKLQRQVQQGLQDAAGIVAPPPAAQPKTARRTTKIKQS